MTKPLVALVLAGGLGTRLAPLTDHKPKCLVEVEGKPFLEWQLDLFARNGVERVVYSTGHLGHQIEDHLRAHPPRAEHGLSVDIVHEKERLDTGGAVVHALPRLPDEFMLTYGDSYLLQPFKPVQEAFEASGCEGLMTVLRQEETEKNDLNALTSENNCEVRGGRVVRYMKKQPRGTFDHMDYGLLFFKKAALAHHPPGAFPTDRIFLDLIARGRLAAFETRAPYYEVGSHEGLRNFGEYLRQNGEGRSAPG